MPDNGAAQRRLFPTSALSVLILIALAATLVLPIYTLFVLSPSFINFIIKSNREIAVNVASHLESLLKDHDSQFPSDTFPEDSLEEIRATVRDFKLLRLSLVLPDGKVIYSTETNATGKIVESSAVRQALKTGRSFARLLTAEMGVDGGLKEEDIMETAVPIVRGNGIVGFFVIYKNIYPDKEALNKILHILYVVFFPITIILFTAIIFSCRKANSNFSRRIEAEEKLRQKQEELETRNEDLMELVSICRQGQHALEEEQKYKEQAQDELQKEMLKREKLRNELLRYMVKAQEEERARIARELHDETAQTLTAASLHFATLQKLLAGNREMTEVVEYLQGLFKQMHKDLYRLVHDLRPAQLDDLGLVPALRYLVDDGQKGRGLKVSFTISGTQKKLEPFIETIIYRFVQEGLTNVTRHAGTSQATVTLCYDEEHVVVRVADKGCGFNVDERQADTGWGLVGIAERIESLKGSFRIDSAPGKGTVLEIIIPLNHETVSGPVVT